MAEIHWRPVGLISWQSHLSAAWHQLQHWEKLKAVWADWRPMWLKWLLVQCFSNLGLGLYVGSTATLSYSVFWANTCESAPSRAKICICALLGTQISKTVLLGGKMCKSALWHQNTQVCSLGSQNIWENVLFGAQTCAKVCFWEPKRANQPSWQTKHIDVHTWEPKYAKLPSWEP